VRGVGAAKRDVGRELTRTPPPLFLRYPQLQRRYVPSRPAFSARIPSLLIHGATDDAFRVTAPSKLYKCLSVLSISAARSSAAPHAISMTAPNAAQWCVRKDERLPLRMALERNVRIARLESPHTASPPFAITSLVIDSIVQIRCMIISFAHSWLLASFDGFKSCYPAPFTIRAQISPTFIASPDLCSSFSHQQSSISILTSTSSGDTQV
jgi:hypothetical protein